MTRIRYTMPVRSQGELRMRRGFVYSMDSDVEDIVRKRLVRRLDSFYCDLQVMRIPRFTGPTRVRTHVVLNDARDSNPRDAAKAIVEATGLNPHLSVCGWPFCLNDVDDVNDAEGV